MAEPNLASRPLALSLDLERTRDEVTAAIPARALEPELAKLAKDTASALLAIPPEDEASKREAKGSVEGMGRPLQAEAARRSAMLRGPVRAIAQAGEDGGPVAKSLVDLKVQVERLDPARFDFSPGWLSRTLGFLPLVGNPIKRYFSQFESAQTVIDAIIESLKTGREQLRRDNVTLEDDRGQMIDLARRLKRQIEFGQAVDQELSAALAKLDERRRAFVEEEILFPLRQRVVDLQTQLAVNQQGALAISVLTRNNTELVRGVNRAVDVTVSALQVAVTVALGLAHQRIVLDKISALKGTTETLIAGTAERLRTQGAEIHQQASQPALQAETLKRAFADIRSAVDDIARYRREALPKLAQTILEFDQLTGEAGEKLDEVEAGERTRPRISLDLKDSNGGK
jgi:uncharacterized protein YaaN involved in tellurite resistance